MDKYLVINAGSSSLKFSLYEMPTEKLLINGYFEKIGFEDSFWTVKINGDKIRKEGYLVNHGDAVSIMIDELISNKIIPPIIRYFLFFIFTPPLTLIIISFIISMGNKM